MNVVVEQSTEQKSAYHALRRHHRRFVDALFDGKSGIEAVKAAGYKGRWPAQRAARLWQKPYIQAALEERSRMLTADVGVRHERVMRELYWVATCDPRKLVDGQGVHIPLHQLPDDIAACISGVEVEEISSDGVQGTRYKYKFWDKNKALDKLGQYLKLWDARQTNVNVDARSVTVNNNSPAGAAALQGAVRLLEQARAIAVSPSATLGNPNGSVLPAAVRDESPGCGTPVDAGEDSGSTGAT